MSPWEDKYVVIRFSNKSRSGTEMASMSVVSSPPGLRGLACCFIHFPHHSTHPCFLHSITQPSCFLQPLSPPGFLLHLPLSHPGIALLRILYFIFKKYFRDRKEEGERKRSIDVRVEYRLAASCQLPTGEGACNLFGAWEGAQPTGQGKISTPACLPQDSTLLRIPPVTSGTRSNLRGRFYGDCSTPVVVAVLEGLV